jgi:ABC-type transport system involved in cytochrome bd biosynthesis fused ATPase/permease subunit
MFDDPALERQERAPRRYEDRYQRFRDIAATLVAFCGGLVVMFLFFAAIGAVNLGDAIGFTIAAIVLTAVWILGAWQRARSGASFVTRPDRERRGF